MTTPNQWVIRDVPKATFINIQTGKPYAYLTDLKTSGIENSAETVYAQGGTGNARIVGFSSNRQAKINLENAVFDNRAIAMMTGNGLIAGAASLYEREVLTVNSNSTTLTYTPSNGTGALVAVFKANADGTEGTELTYTSSTVATGQYSRTTKTLNFFSGDIANGGQVIVYYLVNSDATAQTITVSSDKFAGSYKLVLDAIVKSAYDKQDYAAQIVIPTCKMEDNWSITMAATGDPSTHTMPIEILKPSNSTTMYTMTIYDAGLLT